MALSKRRSIFDAPAFLRAAACLITPAASQSPFKILGRVSCVLAVLFPRVPNKSDPYCYIMESTFLPESHFFFPPRNAFYCIRRQSVLGYIQYTVTGPVGRILS